MSFPFLYLQRRGFRDSDQWGTLFIRTEDQEWERLSWSFELPWVVDKKNFSVSGKSRIKEGEYELAVRTDGAKGWRLELKGTGHRANIQVHRAHKSMYIEGCVLPVDFIDFRNVPKDGVGPVEYLHKGELKIQERSGTLMQKIRKRYDVIKGSDTSNATITIAATLPALEPSLLRKSQMA